MSYMPYIQAAKVGIEFLQRSQETAAQDALYQQNRLAAAQARDLKIQQLQAQANQTSELFAERKRQTSIQELKAQEQIINEATYGGNTLNMKLLDAEAQKLRANDAYTRQNTLYQKQISYQSQGIDAEAQNRINQVNQGVQPSVGMTLFSAAASAYAADEYYNEGKLFSTIFQSGSDATGDNTKPIPATPKLSN